LASVPGFFLVIAEAKAETIPIKSSGFIRTMFSLNQVMSISEKVIMNNRMLPRTPRTKRTNAYSTEVVLL